METSTKRSTEIAPLYFENLSVGDSWFSERREITADDVADFALLTGDHDPLHSDAATASPFGEPIAHGLLGLGVLAGLSSANPYVATLALVSISDWKFEAPIFFGDHVRVRTEIEKLEQHGRRAGRVTWLRQLLNQHGRIVQQGRFETLVATRARARRITTHAEHPVRSLPPR